MPEHYIANAADLTAVADAIRTKGGTTDTLTFPDGFVSAIESIETAASVKAQENKIVTPTFGTQAILPDSGYDYLAKVTVAGISVISTSNDAGGVTIKVGE